MDWELRDVEECIKSMEEIAKVHGIRLEIVAIADCRNDKVVAVIVLEKERK